MLFIRSKNGGFRRCGVAHSIAGREFPGDFFTEDQLARLKADPIITVTYVKQPEPEPEVMEPEPKAKKSKTKGK